jgi:site-specific DNA-cytosine methylase
MEFIERVATLFRGTEFNGLDVGTGSGILAIALAKLGAKGVWAVDVDPVALKVARENLHCNHVEKVIFSSRREFDGRDDYRFGQGVREQGCSQGFPNPLRHLESKGPTGDQSICRRF